MSVEGGADGVVFEAAALLAAKLYERGTLSLGQAAQVAGYFLTRCA